MRWILDKLIDQKQRESAHWNVDVKNPAPGIAISNPTAQGRTDGRGANGRDSVQRERQPSLLGRKRISQDRLSHRLQTSSERALQNPEQKKQTEARCDPTQKGTDCEKHNAGQKESFPPEPSHQ